MSPPGRLEVIPGQSPQEVEKSIVDPDAEIAQGFPSGVMPDTYGQDLTPKQLQDLSDFIVEAAGSQGQGQ
jgi:hypothetical protein